MSNHQFSYRKGVLPHVDVFQLPLDVKDDERLLIHETNAWYKQEDSHGAFTETCKTVKTFDIEK